MNSKFRILDLPSADSQADTFTLEREIDQLVAPRQLYGLSGDKVKIVEGKA